MDKSVHLFVDGKGLLNGVTLTDGFQRLTITGKEVSRARVTLDTRGT